MEPQQQPQKSRKQLWLWVVAFLVLFGSIFAAVYFWNDAQEARDQTSESLNEKNQEETDSVIGSLKNIIQLGDESPTLARVDDPEKLKQSNPDFYANVEVGDYLVLYPQRAIVYRASENKIINIAPILSPDQLQQTQEEQSTQPEVEEDGQTQNSTE